jgi:actin-related protein 2
VDKEYRLPDGSLISVGRERFEAPECLFNPMLIDVESVGIAELIYDSITESPVDVQRSLVANVTLAGGTTMFPGLSSRVEKDLKECYVRDKFNGDRKGLNRLPIIVHDPPRRKHGVFLGASFIAQNTPDANWISINEYKEKGEKMFLKV